MSDYLPLQELTADELNADFGDLEAVTTAGDRQNTSGQTSSTVYTATLSAGAACGLAFVAPPSGKVLIFNACQMSNTGGDHCFCAVRVGTGATIGSGTEVLAASDTDAVMHDGIPHARLGVSRLLTGLTAGATYNAQQRFRVAANTGTFENKSLVVQGVQ